MPGIAAHRPLNWADLGRTSVSFRAWGKSPPVNPRGTYRTPFRLFSWDETQPGDNGTGHRDVEGLLTSKV